MKKKELEEEIHRQYQDDLLEAQEEKNCVEIVSLLDLVMTAAKNGSETYDSNTP